MSQTGTKDSRNDVPLTHLGNRWAGTFSPGWYYEPGLKGPLVPRAKNAEANAKLGHRSKVCSVVVWWKLSSVMISDCQSLVV